MKRRLPEPVRSLDAVVSGTLESRTRAVEDTLTSYIAEASDPVSVKLIVEAVCTDRDLRERCFHTSLAHPLGFDKFLLVASESYDLRLHVWWPNEARLQEDIHDHRFSLYSGIITGELRVSIHELCGEGNVMRHFEEIHSEGNHEYEYLTQGCARVRQISGSSLSRGSAYYLRSGMLHQVSALRGKISATLFIQVIEPHITSHILRDVGDPSPTAGMRQNLGARETERRIQSFLDVLA